MIGENDKMKRADETLLAQIEALASNRKAEIRHSKDELTITGTAYYVNADGDDFADGKTPATAWRTLKRVSSAELQAGDGVFFRRGDIFRGYVEAKTGVTYAAYGQGEKPKLYGWDTHLADETKWELYDKEQHIWRWKDPILDCGTLVFDGGEKCAKKLIPSYLGGRFVLRDDPDTPFEISKNMQRDLDMFCRYNARVLTNTPYGESDSVPLIDRESLGELYLRSDRGNPARVFHDIEALPSRHMFYVGEHANVRIDNLCIQYVGAHGIAAWGHVKGLSVTNCEIGWIGGCIQHYNGNDPNYPEGRRGIVTRFGNGVEIYGGCENYRVENCYIYQVYDAGITHQITTDGGRYEMNNIFYLKNVVEDCVYSIEYFLEKTKGDTQSTMSNVVISGNILRRSGYGWGQQRYNPYTPAHIKSWNYENTAQGFVIEDNVFDRAAYRMLHIVAKEEQSLPSMNGNTYIQTLSYALGQFGAYEHGETEDEMPENIVFDENAERTVAKKVGDKTAKVYFTDR